MHYYQHNIGDYARDTGHLSVIEHGVYRLLLDWCYLNEKPITTEQAIRVSRGNPVATQSVLSEFFIKTEEGWRHKRVDAEVAHYHQQAEKNRKNGLKGGRRKPKENPVGSQSGGGQNPNGGPNQEPITNNQEPLFKEPKGSLSASKLPDCPHGQILELWKQKCPMLAQPRTWEGARRANLKARWIQAAKPSAYSPEGYKTESDGLEWWSDFFEYISQSQLAEGFMSNGRCWKPDLEWVVNATNFQKIVDGKYDR